MVKAASPKSKNQFADPAYARIQRDMRRRINVGEWTRGMLLPGRLDLARQYQVSLFTLQRAVSDLLADGTLVANSRKGTYVSETAVIEPPHNFLSTDRTAPDLAQHLGTLAIISSILGGPEAAQGGHNFWLASVIRAAEDAFVEAGGSVVIYNRLRDGQDRVPIDEAIRTARQNGANAIALLELNPIGHEIGNATAELNADPVPFVCTSGDEIMAPLPHICYDSRQAGYEAAEHLIRQGCDQIVYLAPYTARWSSERLDGVRTAVEDARLDRADVVVIPDANLAAARPIDFEEYASFLARQLDRDTLVGRGIVAQNDYVAIGLMRGASELGLTAGRDYAVVGFDDITESLFAGLTTMRPPLEAMGREAANSIVNQTYGRRSTGHIRLRSRLVTRSSSIVGSPRVMARIG